jgi:hypothetical protein
MSGWRRFFDPADILPAATPRMLAFVRIVVCGILLIIGLWEDLPSTTLLPPEMRKPLGFLIPLEKISGGAFAWLCQSPRALLALQAATCVTFFLALIGFRTRFMVASGALLGLLFGAMMRQYAWFYHTGLVPLYALAVLAFTPCGVAWSVDRWLARRAGRSLVPDDEPRSIDAWSVYTVWIVVAVPYVMAGLGKVRAGLDWFHPHSFKAILLVDALQPMHFSFDSTPLIMALPDWAIVAMAITAVAGEISMGALLILPKTRWWLPLTMVGMHLGIWFLQRVLFFDLILIQLIFLAPPRWFARGWAEPVWKSAPRAWPRAILALLVVLAVVWATRFEWFPLTDMHMYTHVDTSGAIRYPRIVAHLASGRTIDAAPETVIGAMSDARYRMLLQSSKREGERAVAEKFFAVCGPLFDRVLAPEDRVVSFEVVWRRWDFVREPRNPERGKVNKRIRYELSETDGKTVAKAVEE